MGDPKLSDNIFPNQSLGIHVPDICQWFNFNPLGEVIHADQQPSLIPCCLREMSYNIQTPLSKWPRARQRIKDSLSWWMFGTYLWHWSHFFTYSCVSFYMFSHQYPWVRALWDKNLPPVWIPQIPSCNSLRSSFDASGCMHRKYGPLKECLYNFWSLDSQNWWVFLRTLSAFDFSSGKISSLRNSTMEFIQLGPTLIWWIWTTPFFTLVGLHKSLTRITRGKFCIEEVARVAKESACVFPLLGTCNKLKDSNPNCKCLA